MPGDAAALHKRLDDHAQRFKEYDASFDKLIAAQCVSTDAITSLTESVTELVTDTSAIIQLHRDFQGAARVGSGVQGFLIWCLKWGAIGTGIATGVVWVVDHFNN